jgi:PAS domain S-box-containing protein
MNDGIDIDKLSIELSKIQKRLESLRIRCIADPSNAKDIWNDFLKQLRENFDEPSAVDAETAKQNADLIVSRESLKQANKRLAMAQRAAGAGIWDWDTITNHIEWSMELFDLFGLDPQSTMASFEAWNAILHPDDREIANFRIEKALRERTTLNNEYRIMLPNGRLRWINAVGEGVYDDQGRGIRMIGICIDITERKRGEEQLWTTLESIRDGFFACDADWQFVYVNAPAERILGINRKEVLGKNHWEVFPLTLGTNLESEYLRAAAGEVRDFENFYEPWGRWFHNRCYPREGGGMSVYFEDITERKRKEVENERLLDELTMEKARWQSTVENMIDPVVVSDAEGRAVWMNRTYQQLIDRPIFEGLSVEEHPVRYQLYRPNGALFLAEDLPLQKAALTGEEVRNVEIIQRSSTGREFTGIFNASPLKDATGRIIGAVAVGHDYTELKKSEKSLRESESRFGLALKNAPVSIAAQDLDLRFIWAYNQRTVPPEEVVGKTDKDIFIPVDAARLIELKRKVIETGKEVREQLWLTRNGKPMFLDVYFEPIRDAIGEVTGIGIATVDLTEHKLMEEELKRSKDELEQRVQERTKDLETINKELQIKIDHHERAEKELRVAKEAAEEATNAKAAFMANMSHELRTPMNAVIGMTSLLLMEDLTSEQKDYVETIRQSGEALMALINEVLDFSRLERGKTELEKQSFNLRHLVEESLDLVAVPAATKGLELTYYFEQSAPEAIVSDPARLRQVLNNLLGNAVKFTDNGNVVLSVSGTSEEVHFAVQDTGIGIPRGQMHHLFQPFSQLDMSISRGYDGAGLGLAISKKLVELLGGRIWAASELGKGSTFYFTIKALEAPAQPKPFLAASQPLLQGKTVLIVASNRTLRSILSHQVHSWGMTPLLAESATKAYRLLLSARSFDLVLADLNTPDAVSMLREISGFDEDLPQVVLVSAGHKISLDLPAIVTRKPLKPADLHEALTKVLSEPEEEAAEIGKPEEEIEYSSLRILLAEDNISNQKMTILMLKKLGYRADTVANGQEVLQSLERQPYDVILMDVKMPVMNGLQATKAIRERWPGNGLKIVALTAYALPGDEKRCLAAGMDAYLSKPVNMYDLAEIMSRYDPIKEAK